MSGFPARSAVIWSSLLLALTLSAVLAQQRPPAAVAVVVPLTHPADMTIQATSTLTDNLAAIVAAELLLDPIWISVNLPAVVR